MKKHLIFLLLWIPFFTHAQVSFLENKGQWEKEVLFRFGNGNTNFFLERDGYTMLLQDAEGYRRANEYHHGHAAPKGFDADGHNRIMPSIKSHAYKVKFLGAIRAASIETENELPGYDNFFIGNDRSRWASFCKSYGIVRYQNLYLGIDLVYYTQDNQLKYDLVLQPGADISQITLKYDGVTSMVLRNNDLVIETSVGEAMELRPYTYQIINGKKQEVSCAYRVNGNTVSFAVDNYNKAEALVIDPSIVFSSYTGSQADNWGFCATYGSDGSFFSAGIAQPTGFPVSAGAFQETGGGSTGSAIPPDIAIMKLSSDGKTKLYATYLGGSGIEQPHSIIADASGNLILTGRTNSGQSFPGNLAGVGGGYDLFVTKLNASGTALIGSLRIGGSGDDGVNISSTASGAQSTFRSYGDNARSEVILDAANNILLTSCTRSINFPVVSGTQSGLAGTQDAVILKLNENATALTWSSYFGGSGDEAGFGITLHASNNTIYIAGGTTSTNLPGVNQFVLQSQFLVGITDGYIARFRDNGNSLTLDRATYLGTTGADIVYAVKVDKAGFPYVTGTSTGNWPVINAAYAISNSRQFISKLQPDLSSFVYSTTFGSGGTLIPNLATIAFSVDDCENVYVAGWGGAVNSFGGSFPSAGTTGLPVTTDAFQTQTDGSDFYIFVLQKNAATQLFGSFFGQNGGNGGYDHIEGGMSRFDSSGVLYLAACAGCKSVPTNLPAVSPFPITQDVYGPANLATTGSGCNQGMTKIRFDFSGSACTVTSVNGIGNEIRSSLSLFPNPGNGRFQVRLKLPNANGKQHTLRIHNTKGQLVFIKTFSINRTDQQLPVDLHNSNRGIYLVELTNENGVRVASSKLVIN